MTNMRYVSNQHLPPALLPSLSPSAPSEWSTGSPILRHGGILYGHGFLLRSHNFARYGVYMFITPLLLLPLLASSYAEVNYEGVKVIQVLAAEIQRLVLDILLLFRVSFQPRRGSTCSSTSMAILSR